MKNLFARFFTYVAPIVALLLLLVSPAHAVVLQDIKVVGNERVDISTIKTYLPTQRGADFDAANVGDVIKTLYATGLFHQVDVRVQDGVLVVNVLENPLVNEVAIEGNSEIVSERLKENLILKPRGLFTPAKAQRDAQLIEDIYRSRGRFLTRVTPQIIGRDQNRVDVIYSVEEGEETDIAKISFIGNSRFSDADLKDVITTKETRFWRLLGGDQYDPNRIEVDKDILRRHYLQHGYIDFQVQSAVAELSRDRSRFYVTFTVSEGPKYDFGDIQVALNAEDDVENLTADDLQRQVTLQSGELYNARRVDENIDDIVDFLGSRGFAFLDVAPKLDRDEAMRTVDLTFEINPGPRVYVERINIEGNTRTRDEVVRRELRLAEGDAFSATKLQRSRDRVNRLGYFKKVEMTREATDDPDRLDVTVAVEEQSTGEFNVGAGFSTFEGLLASADLRERNFLGRGQDVALRFALSETRQNYSFSFTEPYFMNQELAAGVDVFNELTDVQDESSFDRGDLGGGLRFTFPINEFARNSVRLGYRQTEISNVGSGASSLVARDVGEQDSLTLANTFTYDTRDSVLNPTRGYSYSLGGTYSGFGGDVEYIRATARASWHTELLDDVILSLGGNVGVIHDLGTRLPIYEHFSAGGASLRGFENSGIGPRDRNTNDALGGKYILGNKAEISFPLWFLDDLGVRGLVFTDGGIVTEFDEATAVVENTDVYRVTVGAGVHWQSPVGPLRVEFGIPVNKAEEDQTQVFSFSIGSNF